MRFAKKGQLAIILIIAVVLIVAVIAFFVFRGGKGVESIPTELAPVYDYYSACVQQEAKAAADLAGTQGGHVFLPTYVPGSEYAPFSSQLNFLGFGVPYWMTISGNGIVKEQVPTKQEMEKEMGTFISQRLLDCDFERFAQQGIHVTTSVPKVMVSVEDQAISVSVDAEVDAVKEGSSAQKSKHDVEIASSLGALYESAKKIYASEKENAFLEGYAEDVLRLYAPVDGVEISCSPRVWKVADVEQDLKNALEQNMGSIRTQPSVSQKGKDYFFKDLGVNIPVSFRYAQDWPTKIEIHGTNGALMLARPVGNAQGMGAMGFCYSPYHFVYDVSFPVMVQMVQEDGSVFQFPLVVVLDKNLPRKGFDARFSEPDESSNICTFLTQDFTVKTYDVQLHPLETNVSYQCFEKECSLGQTSQGVLHTKAPACLNGNLHVSAGGYADKQTSFSTNSISEVELILDRVQNVRLTLRVDGKPLLGNALVSFEGSQSVTNVLPDSGTVALSEGAYNVSVYVYGNSSIVIPASSKRECTQVSSGGIFGFFGSTKEQCFDVAFPETKIESALIGGGKSSVYLLPEMIANGTLSLDVKSFPQPKAIEQLQINYELLEQSGVDIW